MAKSAEERRAYNKAYREKNKERLVAYGVAYRSKNKEVCNARSRKYHAENRDSIRRQKALKKYGITKEQYDNLLRRQNYKCAVCATDSPDGAGDWHIDHCHNTGAVRGLLCSKCNVGLGMFNDDPEALRLAASYIEKHK